jgi:hypothetical protein
LRAIINLEEATWIGEAPRLDARCVRRETDAGDVGFATRMDDADMSVSRAVRWFFNGAERPTRCRRFARRRPEISHLMRRTWVLARVNW